MSFVYDSFKTGLLENFVLNDLIIKSWICFPYEHRDKCYMELSDTDRSNINSSF